MDPLDLGAIRKTLANLEPATGAVPLKLASLQELAFVELPRCLAVIEALRAALQGMKDERGGHGQGCNIFLGGCTCIEGRVNAALARVSGGTDA